MNKYARLSLCLVGLVILALPTSADAVPFTWTGFYIGGNAGVGWGGESTSVDLEGFNYFAANPAPGEVTKVGDDTLSLAEVRSGTTTHSATLSQVLKPTFQGSNSTQLKSPPVQKRTGGRTLGSAWKETGSQPCGAAWASPWIDGSYTALAARHSPTANIAITTSAIGSRRVAAAFSPRQAIWALDGQPAEARNLRGGRIGRSRRSICSYNSTARIILERRITPRPESP
jgi:hypothetical protein